MLELWFDVSKMLFVRLNGIRSSRTDEALIVNNALRLRYSPVTLLVPLALQGRAAKGLRKRIPADRKALEFYSRSLAVGFLVMIVGVVAQSFWPSGDSSRKK